MKKLLIFFVLVLNCFCSSPLEPPTLLTVKEISQLSKSWDGNWITKDLICKFAFNNGKTSITLACRKQTYENLQEETKLQFSKLDDYYVFQYGEFISKIDTSALKSKPGTENYFNNPYYFAKPIQKNANPQPITIDDLFIFLKNHTILFYTGAGISAPVVWTMNTLQRKLFLNPKDSISTIESMIYNVQEVNDNFITFCKRAFASKPTKAHIALSKLANYKQYQIFTENFDHLHERTGFAPFHLTAQQFKKEFDLQELEELDAIICLGLSHDDRGFLAYYKQINPNGLIIAIDLANPSYLSTHDYLLTGDLQKILPILADKIS